MNNIKLTIFTPTYNRGNTITNTYESLISQSSKDFVWLVIDDGSSDNTELLIKNFIEENIIKIEYYKKTNGGKHTAYNEALDKLKTEYVYLSLDSDDVLYNDNTVSTILNEINSLEKEQVGIITLCTTTRNNNEKNGFVKKYDLTKLNEKTLAEAYKGSLMNAECRMILKSEYVKKFKYPEIKGERFFTEAYTYWQMDEKVKWTNLNTCYSNYLIDGLTANTNKLFLNNSVSWYMYNELRLKNTHNVLKKIKYYIYYISFGLLSRRKVFKSEINYLLVIILFPISIIGALYLKYKGIKK